jgi:hypothetical protein
MCLPHRGGWLNFATLVGKATIVIASYHAFQHRETWQMSRVGRAYLQGNDPEPIRTLETDGQTLDRACCGYRKSHPGWRVLSDGLLSSPG